MQKNHNTLNEPRSHRWLFIVLASVVVLLVLALISAFVWPGWALNRHHQAADQQNTQQVEQKTTPSIPAVALPQDATDLLKTLPDTVLDYARVSADKTQDWAATKPTEEYTARYDSGEHQLTLHIGQWATEEESTAQYKALTATQKGQEIASGAVKVGDKSTGDYLVSAQEQDAKKAVATWRNSTVICQLTGDADQVKRIYSQLPI